MLSLSYRSPKTEVRQSPIHGRGLFATGEFGRGEVVGVKGRHIVNREQMREISARLGSVEIQIDWDLFRLFRRMGNSVIPSEAENGVRGHGTTWT